MAKFCNQCGRPLADGEICQCQRQNTASVSGEDGIPFRKLIGAGESDNNDVQGCFERGKRIVPELAAPCEKEVHVKQYHICNARSRIRGLWQEGNLQVTNKRILFRLSGRSWIGRAMTHTEVGIDEIASISISKGVRFGLWDFLFGVFVSGIVMSIGRTLGMMPAVLAYILGIALAIPFFAFKKKYFIKMLCLAGAEGVLLSSSARLMFLHPVLSGFGALLAAIAFVLYIAVLILFSLKPSLAITIMTKCVSAQPIYIWSRQTMISTMEVLPGEDADIAVKELGAMVTDIQSLGETGVEKWKENEVQYG
ncbi:MAG: hypothetical protein QM793_02045 [Muricomes sp.]